MRANQESQLVSEEILADPSPRSSSISSSNDAVCGKTISRMWQHMKKTMSELGFLSNQSAQGRFSSSRSGHHRSRESEKSPTPRHGSTVHGSFKSSSWKRTPVTSVRNRTVPIPIQDPSRLIPRDSKMHLEFGLGPMDMDYNMNSASKVSMNQPSFEPCEEPSELADLSVKSDGWYDDNQIVEDEPISKASRKSFQVSRSLGTSGFSTFMRGLKCHFHGKDRATEAIESPITEDRDHEFKLGLSMGLGRSYQGIDLSLPSKQRSQKRKNTRETVAIEDEELGSTMTKKEDDSLDDTAKTDEIEIPSDETTTMEKQHGREEFKSLTSDILDEVLTSTDSGVCMEMYKLQTEDEESMYSLQDIDGALHAICDDEVLISKPAPKVVSSIKIPDLRSKLLSGCAIVGALTKDGRQLSPRQMVAFEHHKPLVSTFQTI